MSQNSESMPKEETTNSDQPKRTRRSTGRRIRNQKLALPRRPALPVKALWELATTEQQEKAHHAAVAMMEYWTGRITRLELAQRLKVPPLRVWQLSQQAISGMVAGLLIQPKTRVPKGAKNMGFQDEVIRPEEDPKVLKARIAELEKLVATQNRLISVLREMPGCRDATIPMEETPSEISAQSPTEGITNGAMQAQSKPKRRGRPAKSM